MMRALAVVALLAISSCATTPPSGMAPYCTSQSSFGIAFGPDPEFDGEIRRLDSLSDPAFEPFDSVEVVRSRLSGTIHTVSAYRLFMAPGFQADREASERTFNELRAQIEASGAFTIFRERPTSVIYDSIATAPNAQLRMWLFRFPEKVSLACTRWASYRRMWSELPADQRERFDEAVRQARERWAEEPNGDGRE